MAGASAAAVCVAMNNRGFVQSIADSEMRKIEQEDAERKRQMEEIRRRRDQMEALFKKYDENGSKFLEREEVRKLLEAFNDGVPPTEGELNYILKTCGDKRRDGAIGRSKLRPAIVEWSQYKKALEKAGSLDQGDGTLPAEQLQAYLESLHVVDGPIGQKEVDFVLQQAEEFGSGGQAGIGKEQLAMAAQVWKKRRGGSQACCVVL